MPSNVERARSPMRRNDATHAIVINVRPNDNPKVAGLRSDSGPAHEPPPTMRIATWMSPLISSRAPRMYARRSTVIATVGGSLSFNSPETVDVGVRRATSAGARIGSLDLSQTDRALDFIDERLRLVQQRLPLLLAGEDDDHSVRTRSIDERRSAGHAGDVRVREKRRVEH